MIRKLSGRPPLSGDALVPRTETRVDRLLPGSLSVRAGAFRTLANRFGEGELADHILAKWLSDPEAGAKWERLAAVVEVKWNGIPLPTERRHRPHKYWVILWYASMGYSNNQIADQLSIGVESVKQEIKYARRKLGLKGAPRAHMVAVAIRRGLIP